MKTLISTLFAGLFVLAVATAVHAGMSGTGLGSIDSSGTAVVAIHSPGMSTAVSSNEKAYLDSNKVWAVNDIRTIPVERTFLGQKGAANSNLYCFDSGSRFCARAY